MAKKWNQKLASFLVVLLLSFWIALPAHSHANDSAKEKDHCASCQLQQQNLIHSSAHSHSISTTFFYQDISISFSFYLPSSYSNYIPIRGPPLL